MATNEEIVAAAQQLYVSYYGRPADPGGLEFWIDYFTDTDNVDAALSAFGESAEFQAILDANPTSEELIDQLYQFMFNRDAEPEGREFYSDLLDSGEASLASIALDIANGAQNEDRTALDNKITVANSFTAEIESENAPYTAANIPTAQALLADVDDTAASVSAAQSQISDIVEAFNGIVELDEDNPTADYSDFSVGVTVTLAGDEDETEFNVTGSPFDDTFIFEEYFKATIAGGSGTDTANFADADGAYTISLGTGTFSADTNADGLPEFTGNLSSIESVIGSEAADTINGSDASERIDGGGGVDVLRGGAGDDTFVYGDEDDLAGETVDGQTGTDVLEFTSDAVDLTTTNPANVSAESLLLSNSDASSTVSLALNDTAGFGPDEFTLITGSSAIDTLSVGAAVAADFSATQLVSIDVLSSSVVALNVKASTLTEVVTLSGPGLGEITASAAGTYDLAGTTLTGWDTLDGVNGSGGVIWVLNQTQIDSLLDDTTTTLFGADMADAGTTTVPNDTLQASGSLDLTRITGGVNVYEIDFGTATTIEIDEGQLGGGLELISGASGTLLLNDGGDNAIDLDALALDLQDLDELQLRGASDVALTIGDQGTFSGIKAITGSTDDLTVAVATNVDITGTDMTPFDTLTFSGANGNLTLQQAELDNFDEWGTGLAGGTTLTFVLGGNLNLSAVDFDDTFAAASTLVVTGTDDADTVTGADGDAAGAITMTYNLGEGDDTFKGTDKTNATGAVTVNGGDDDDTITLADSDTGANTANGDDGDDKITAGDNGDTLNGGAGDDTLIAGEGTDVLNGGAGDDTLTAADATDTLTGGTGEDVFTMAMDILGVTITDFNGVGTAEDDDLRLDFNINGTTTAFSGILAGNRLPVLQIGTTTGGTTGDVNNINANNAAGSNTSALPSLANTTAARAFINTSLANGTALGDSSFVLFATAASSLVAYIVTEGTMTTSVTSGEISVVTIAALGGAGAISASDLILI